MVRPRVWPLFALLVAVLVPLEIACGMLAYHTLGEIERSVYLVAVCLNVPLLFLAARRPNAAGVGVFLLGLAIVPYQLHLARRLLRVESEVTRIIAYAYRHREQFGTFPSHLGGYAYADPAAAPFIQSYEGNATAFGVTYRIGSPNTSHWFSSKTGWGYYAD